QPDELLLGAVVKVTLDAAPRGISGVHQAGPRGGQFRLRRLELSVQPRSLQLHGRGGPGRVDVTISPFDLRVVHDRRDGISVVSYPSNGALVRARRGSSRRIHKSSA